MKIAVFGATGTIGQRIVNEALSRGHEVIAISRDPSRIQKREHLEARQGELMDVASIAAAVQGADAVVSSFGPTKPEDTTLYGPIGKNLVAGVTGAGVSRLLFVGGAGSLEIAPGKLLFDTAEFPAAWRPLAVAHKDTLDYLRSSVRHLDWSYLSPAAFVDPGIRTGHFRIGGDELVVDEKGESRISTEDFAVALIDELETPHQIQKRFTVAY